MKTEDPSLQAALDALTGAVQRLQETIDPIGVKIAKQALLRRAFMGNKHPVDPTKA